MDSRRSSNALDHSQTRGREDTEILGVPRQSEDLAASHQQRAARRPRLLYVPTEHEPDDEPGRLPSSCRWAYLIFFHRLKACCCYIIMCVEDVRAALTRIHRETFDRITLRKKKAIFLPPTWQTIFILKSLENSFVELSNLSASN